MQTNNTDMIQERLPLRMAVIHDILDNNYVSDEFNPLLTEDDENIEITFEKSNIKDKVIFNKRSICKMYDYKPFIRHNIQYMLESINKRVYVSKK